MLSFPGPDSRLGVANTKRALIDPPPIVACIDRCRSHEQASPSLAVRVLDRDNTSPSVAITGRPVARPVARKPLMLSTFLFPW